MKSLSCLSFIMRHIANLKDGEIFTTRDCLKYGLRANVDYALYRAVKKQIIVRLARGVFTRNTKNYPKPSHFEMAIIKARAFGKVILKHGKDTAARLDIEADGNPEPTYYVDGSSSRFFYQKTYINLKKACKKRMHIPDDRVGLALRALWHKGKEWVRFNGVDFVFSSWSTRADKEKIHANKAWIPSWLADYFENDVYLDPLRTGNQWR